MLGSAQDEHGEVLDLILRKSKSLNIFRANESHSITCKMIIQAVSN